MSKEQKSVFCNMDCMEGMKEYPDKYFDLAIVDPPYGINSPNMSMGSNKSRSRDGYPGVSTAEKLRKGRLNAGAGRKRFQRSTLRRNPSNC